MVICFFAALLLLSSMWEGSSRGDLGTHLHPVSVQILGTHLYPFPDGTCLETDLSTWRTWGSSAILLDLIQHLKPGSLKHCPFSCHLPLRVRRQQGYNTTHNWMLQLYTPSSFCATSEHEWIDKTRKHADIS